MHISSVLRKIDQELFLVSQLFCTSIRRHHLQLTPRLPVIVPVVVKNVEKLRQSSLPVREDWFMIMDLQFRKTNCNI
jgi:hypothetical protein